MKSSRARDWLANGSLVVVALVVTLFLAEAAVRLLYPQPTGLSHQDRYGLSMHWPGMTRYLPQFGHEITFNSEGMRDSEHTIARQPGVFRVLLLGDSFMEAQQVTFESSMPNLLREQLSKQTGRQVEVVTAGVGGWGNDDELRWFEFYGVKYKPDLVVVAMTLHNDITDNLKREWYALQDGQLVDQDRQPMSFLRYKVVQIKSFLSTRFQLYQLWRRARHSGEIRQAGRQLNSYVVQLFRQPTTKLLSDGLDLTGGILGKMQQLAKADGGEIAVVMLPIQYQVDSLTFSGFVAASQIPQDQMDLGKPQSEVLKLTDRLGIPTIDLLPAFRHWAADSSARLFLETDGHWTENGHRLAAQTAAEGLVSMGLIN